jgi:hypothetical protein
MFLTHTNIKGQLMSFIIIVQLIILRFVILLIMMFLKIDLKTLVVVFLV